MDPKSNAKALLEYQNAKRILDGLSIIEQEKLNKKLEKYEKDKVKMREKYHQSVREGGFEFLEKRRLREKELYHLRKLKAKKDKEEKMHLEELRAERSKANGNPFGKEFDKLKMKDSDEDTLTNESENEDESESEGSAYCSTCPTTDTESVASTRKPRKKKVETIPEPPQKVQNIFNQRTFNWV